MFNSRSDPWYNYMQPFRVAMLKHMIKVHHYAEAKAAVQTTQENTKKEEITKP